MNALAWVILVGGFLFACVSFWATNELRKVNKSLSRRLLRLELQRLDAEYAGVPEMPEEPRQSDLTFRSLGRTMWKSQFEGPVYGDEIWECSACAAAVADRERHTAWHDAPALAPSEIVE